MAEFDQIERQREDQRRKVIANAVDRRLAQAREYKRCARCNAEFREVDVIGRRECSFHPELYNITGYGDDESPMPRHWSHHHSCCGWSSEGVMCGAEPAVISRAHFSVSGRGCTPCEHSDTSDVILPPSLLGHSGAVTMQLSVDPVADNDDDDALAGIVRIEPIFFLRVVASQRNIDLATPGGLRRLLGGAASYVATDPTCLSPLHDNTARFPLGPERFLKVSLRSAYVAMMQRYGLPTSILSGSGLNNARCTHQQQQQQQQLPEAAQSFMATFLPGLQGGLARENDVMAQEDTGQWASAVPGDGRINTAAPGLQADSYYDVHPTRTADGEYLPDASSSSHSTVAWQDMSTSAFITSLCNSLAGPSANAERFYPFCIWLTCDAYPICSAPPDLGLGVHHRNARF